MIYEYELKTRREGRGYTHFLIIRDDSSADKVIVWGRNHAGVNADMINNCAKFHKTQLTKSGLEEMTAVIKIPK